MVYLFVKHNVCPLEIRFLCKYYSYITAMMAMNYNAYEQLSYSITTLFKIGKFTSNNSNFAILDNVLLPHLQTIFFVLDIFDTTPVA